MEYIPNESMKRYNHLLGELQAVYHDISNKLGMSDSASLVLYTICNAGGKCPIHTICKESGLSKQTVNSALRKLEQQQIVYLEAADKRAKTVCLTEEGKAYSQKTAVRIIEIENDIMHSWDKHDVELYLALTEKFLLDLKAKADAL